MRSALRCGESEEKRETLRSAVALNEEIPPVGRAAEVVRALRELIAREKAHHRVRRGVDERHHSTVN